MSYGRDGDRHTRGVGAIAAVDGAHPARARARARRVQQSLAMRERAIGGLAYGPGGGLSSLGRINLANIGAQGFRAGQIIAPDHSGGTGGPGGGVVGPAPGGATAGGGSPRTGVKNGPGIVLGTGGRTTPKGFEGRPAMSTVPRQPVIGIPPKITGGSGKPNSGGSILTGSGGGGGGSSGGGSSTTDPDPVVTAPVLPDVPSSTSTSSIPTWALILGAAAGLYLLTKDEE